MLGLDELPLTQREAYHVGYGAYQGGQPITDNPHGSSSYHGTLWDWGWADADNDARED